MVMKDRGEIIAVARWNMLSPTEAKVLDFIVHPNYRHRNFSKIMFKKAQEAMPLLEDISFQRKKYGMRTSHHKLSKWIKEKNHEWKILANSN